MKHVKKIFAFVMALAMTLAFVTPAFAEGDEPQTPTTGNITITLPTDSKGNLPTNPTTYTIYKVFDATNDGSSSAISYRLLSNENEEHFKGFQSGELKITDFFTLDDAGVIRVNETNAVVTVDGKKQLNANAIAILGAYAKSLTDNVTTLPVAAGTAEATVNVGYGYFYIDTTTGSAVTVTSTNPNVKVEDKNSLTTVDKTAENGAYAAIQELGGDQPFFGTITLGKGATQVKYHDTMTKMTYNGDLKVTINDSTEEVKPVDPTTGKKNYTVITRDDGFDVEFEDQYIATLETGDVIHLNYTGKVVQDATYDADDADNNNGAATNDASVTWGNDGTNEQKPSEPVKVYTATIGVNKSFDPASEGLTAGFILYKNVTENGTTVKKYYKLDDGVVTWVDKASADERTTNATGNLEQPFAGLDNGEYYLEEKTVPAGFNQALDVKVTIADSISAANLNQVKDIVNKQGTVMPSTGGIGTTIFYVVGGVMVAGAVIFLLTKRRAASNVE